MATTENLKDALIDVRKAHRLIASYQKIMLSVVYFIKKKLAFPGFSGEKRFSNPLRGRGGLNIWPDMWPWDFLYSYQFEYRLGSKELPDGSQVFLSIVQYSDTGYYDSDGSGRDDMSNPATFKAAEDSSSKLLFLMEYAPKGGQLRMADHSYNEIFEIVHKKEVGGSSHKSSIVPAREGQENEFLLYSLPIERLLDEKSTLDALQEYLRFLKENGIVLTIA
jgi:hypothetical protein